MRLIYLALFSCLALTGCSSDDSESEEMDQLVLSEPELDLEELTAESSDSKSLSSSQVDDNQ